jgi:hypothetical protein
MPSSWERLMAMQFRHAVAPVLGSRIRELCVHTGVAHILRMVGGQAQHGRHTRLFYERPTAGASA